MPNYLYYRHEDEPLNERFNLNFNWGDGYKIEGITEWDRLTKALMQLLSPGERAMQESQIRRETLNELGALDFNMPGAKSGQESKWHNLRTTEELVLLLLLAKLKIKSRPTPQNNCPRLFISHRQPDITVALRIAQLAARNKFAYWVDVLDPKLANAIAGNSCYPIWIACIIEMALINCTHVIACMTPNTRGSLWLPYEYGRIPTVAGGSRNAASWHHPNLAATDFPEYMVLGECLKKEKEIEDWLADEYKLAGLPGCCPKGGDELPSVDIEKLPEESDFEIYLKAEKSKSQLR